tara:strand:- start:642 stop:1250 length:609 start_codon:yes stop_codon:yes gene_type:complete
VVGLRLFFGHLSGFKKTSMRALIWVCRLNGEWGRVSRSFLFLEVACLENMDQFGTSVSDLVIPLLEDLGFELVDVELDNSGSGKTVRLLIHRSQGVTLDDCQQVIESTRPILDVCGLIKHNWDLEVASPGLDRPIVTKADFQRNLGQTIEMRFQSSSEGKIKNVNGILKEVDSKKITLQHSSGKVVQVSISKVEQATAKLNW